MVLGLVGQGPAELLKWVPAWLCWPLFPPDLFHSWKTGEGCGRMEGFSELGREAAKIIMGVGTGGIT